MVKEELNTGVGVNVEGFLFALLLILDIGRLWGLDAWDASKDLGLHGKDQFGLYGSGGGNGGNSASVTDIAEEGDGTVKKGGIPVEE